MVDPDPLDPVLRAAVPDGALGFFVHAQLRKFVRKDGPTRLERFASQYPFVLPGVFVVLLVLSAVIDPNVVLLVLWVLVLGVLAMQSAALRLSVHAWDMYRGR